MYSPYQRKNTSKNTLQGLANPEGGAETGIYHSRLLLTRDMSTRRDHAQARSPRRTPGYLGDWYFFISRRDTDGYVTFPMAEVWGFGFVERKLGIALAGYVEFYFVH